jgi:hypothetical protein
VFSLNPAMLCCGFPGCSAEDSSLQLERAAAIVNGLQAGVDSIFGGRTESHSGGGAHARAFNRRVR